MVGRDRSCRAPKCDIGAAGALFVTECDASSSQTRLAPARSVTRLALITAGPGRFAFGPASDIDDSIWDNDWRCDRMRSSLPALRTLFAALSATLALTTAAWAQNAPAPGRAAAPPRAGASSPRAAAS